MNNKTEKNEQFLKRIQLDFCKETRSKKGNLLNFIDIEVFDEGYYFLFQNMFDFIENKDDKSKKELESIFSLLNYLYIASQIHNKISDEDYSSEEYLKKVQLPILIGDFLYAKIYEVLGKDDIIDLYDYVVDYIVNLNQAWADYLLEKIDQKILLNYFYVDLNKLAILCLSEKLKTSLEEKKQAMKKVETRSRKYIYGKYQLLEEDI